MSLFKLNLLLKHNFKFYSKLSHIANIIQPMSKQKQLRRIVLDKLYVKKKVEPIYNLKKSTRSNAPTQSTPNQAKNQYKQIEKFFQNFQSQCAIIYQPVVLTHRKPIKRNLQGQLLQLNRQHSRLKTEAYQEQQNKSSKKYRKQKKTQIESNQNSKTRLNTEYCQRSNLKNSSFFEFNKNNKNNCASLIKNKSTIIKKIPTQTSTFSSKIYQNKSTVLSTISISKYTSPTNKVKPYSRPFSKRVTPYQNQFNKRIEESINNQKIIDSQLKNAPKKMANLITNNPQKIKRVQSLRQFNGMKKFR